jgi:radical SAM protein with 4Fe4S-binding SPASM domain
MRNTTKRVRLTRYEITDLDRHLFFNTASGTSLVTDARGAAAIERFISGASHPDSFIDRIIDNPVLESACDDPDYGRVPERLIVEVTRACNLRCKTCYISAAKPREHELATGEIIELLEVASRNGTRTVAFLGGEPFLRRDLPELVETALDLFEEIQVSTNGTIPYSRFLETFQNRSGLVIQVSLDGPNPESNDAVRGAGSHIKASWFLRSARDHGIRTAVSGVLNKHNYNLVGELCDYAFDKGCFLAIFHKVHVFGRAGAFPELIPTGAELKHGMGVLFEKFNQYERAGRMIVDFPHNRCFRGDRALDACYPGCHFGRAFAYVTSEGDLVCCSHLQRGDFNYGNIRDRSLIDIWQGSPALDRMRRLTVEDIPSCSTCRFKYMCRGSCRADALGQAGDLYGDPHDCDALKEYYAYMLDYFARNLPLVKPEED